MCTLFQVAVFDYGMSYENPCEKFWFYSKHHPSKAFRMPVNAVSEMISKIYGVTVSSFFCLRLYFCILMFSNVIAAFLSYFKEIIFHSLLEK